jgi:hypothetical protein
MGLALLVTLGWGSTAAATTLRSVTRLPGNGWHIVSTVQSTGALIISRQLQQGSPTRVVLLDPATGSTTPLSDGTSDLSISPDGQYVAEVTQRGKAWGVDVRSTLAGGAARRIALPASFTPGLQVRLVVASDGAVTALFTLFSHGALAAKAGAKRFSTLVPVRVGSLFVPRGGSVATSPNGRVVAFCRWARGTAKLTIVDARDRVVMRRASIRPPRAQTEPSPTCAASDGGFGAMYTLARVRGPEDNSARDGTFRNAGVIAGPTGTRRFVVRTPQRRLWWSNGLAAVSPDGRQVLIIDHFFRHLLLAGTASNSRRILALPAKSAGLIGGDAQVLWSPLGNTIVVSPDQYSAVLGTASRRWSRRVRVWRHGIPQGGSACFLPHGRVLITTETARLYLGDSTGRVKRVSNHGALPSLMGPNPGALTGNPRASNGGVACGRPDGTVFFTRGAAVYSVGAASINGSALHFIGG